MKRKPSIPSLLLSIVFCSVFAGTPIAESFGRTTSISSGHSVRAQKKSNPTLSLSADALLNKLKQNQPVTLVDIRSPKDFDIARIPGSINIPLYAIKTKAFLKSMAFVLVEDGYRYKSLEKQCKKLRDEGFKSSFLMGGLNAWKQKGGPLRGNAFEQQTFDRISAQIFYEQKNHEEWIIINASKEQTSASLELFPDAFHIPAIDHAEPALLAFMRKAEPEKSSLFCPLLIFNEEGEQYDKISDRLERAGLTNAFYLQGGLSAYEEFLNHLTLSRKPKDERLKSSMECRTCQKGKPHEGAR